MQLHYRTALVYHARAMAALLRPEDALELSRLYPDRDHEEMLVSSVVASEETFLVTDNAGAYVFIGGCGSAIKGSPTGVPWMLATPLIAKYPKDAFKLAREGIRRWERRYAHLCNAMDPANASARRLVRGLGFSFGLIHNSLRGARILPFYRESRPCVT